jgi:hypothetical protein
LLDRESRSSFGVESVGVESLKPCAKFVEFRSGQLGYGFFDVFNGPHDLKDSIFAAPLNPVSAS